MTRTATDNRSGTNPWIPHDVDDDGPVNPIEPNLPPGCGVLGRRGEVRAVDAFITAVTADGQRWVLLIRRRDSGAWALPGGKLNDGESIAAGVVRELAEETTLAIPGVCWRVSDPRYVFDPRNTRHVWMVTVVAHAELVPVLWPPFVEGRDDARQATWVRADTPAQARDDLAARYGGTIWTAHNDLIDEYLA
jgi:ADP-ribose pyrophosphatase YjhB (NUDIX family)